MYNFKNLNDWEFECLCKDIMQKLKSIDLRCFKPGKDGGIDIADNKTMNAVVVQVKNYGSNFPVLFSTLKKEVKKVDKIKPKQYYVCTSLELTKNNIEEIYSLFSPYMESLANIIDGTIIDDFLKKSENQSILNKYFKLWMESTNVMQLMQNREIMIDAEVLKDQIESKQQLYVQTQFYESALKKLIESHSLLITGSPGVGKTTTCNMVVLDFLSKDFAIRYSTSNDIGKIKQAMSADQQVKELIYVDDFLGQSYLELKSDRVSEIYSLIVYVKSFKNKFILLNSRITIHNDATEKYDNYSELLNKLQISLLDISQMSALDKAKILYNHLYFKDVDNERLEQIKSNKNYLKIINHKNYNPRQVEQFTNKVYYEKSQPQGYFKYIIDSLDHPQKIWYTEYTSHISKADRILLLTLFSISNKSLEVAKLKAAFDYRLTMEIDIDTSSCLFEDSLSRLNGSFIKIVTDYNVRKVSMLNPSINDFLRITISEPEKGRITKSAYFVEQLINMDDDFFHGDTIFDLANTGKIFEMNSLENPLGFYYVIGLVSKKFNSFLYADKFFESLKNESSYLDRSTFCQSFIDLISEDFFKINPNIFALFMCEDNLCNLFKHFEKKFAIKFIDIVINEMLLNKSELVDIFWVGARKMLIEIIENDFISETDEQLDSFVDHSFREMNSEEDNIESLLKDEVEQSVDSYIESLIDSQLPISFANGQYEITKKDINAFNVSKNCSISETVNQKLKDHYSDYEIDEDLAREIYHDRLNEDKTIDEIFNR